MEAESIPGSPDFAADFLARLQAIFNYLQPGKIKEQSKNGVLFFKQKYTSICLYNVYPDSVQIILNRNLLSSRFEAVHDYRASAPVEWELIFIMISDILQQNSCLEEELWAPRLKNRLTRSNRAQANQTNLS